jgi:hypothetical protein
MKVDCSSGWKTVVELLVTTTVFGQSFNHKVVIKSEVKEEKY